MRYFIIIRNTVIPIILLSEPKIVVIVYEYLLQYYNIPIIVVHYLRFVYKSAPNIHAHIYIFILHACCLAHGLVKFKHRRYYYDIRI